MSEIAWIMSDQELGRTKSLAKPETSEAMPSVQNNGKGKGLGSASSNQVENGENQTSNRRERE